jgi:hypothetical protein
MEEVKEIFRGGRTRIVQKKVLPMVSLAGGDAAPAGHHAYGLRPIERSHYAASQLDTRCRHYLYIYNLCSTIFNYHYVHTGANSKRGGRDFPRTSLHQVV